MKILLFDNYDSFTYNLRDYLLRCGAEVITYRNDELPLSALLQIPFDALLISPGPGTPEETPNLMPLIAQVAGKKPVLGICLGFQAIGLHFGAELVKAPEPVHGKTSCLQYVSHAMFANISGKVSVCRYHSLALQNIPDTLEVTAFADGGVPMSLAHNQLNIWGHQFHPEAVLTDHGLLMIENWVNHASRVFL
jgi:anthranilate synthase/aminodeoxychorismate synthase-like glutamine amidotransferase